MTPSQIAIAPSRPSAASAPSSLIAPAEAAPEGAGGASSRAMSRPVAASTTAASPSYPITITSRPPRRNLASRVSPCIRTRG
ncbi:MAG TPA: hypothetical protein VGD80_37450 [Kofleriaceae bacterium]